ncbi:putative kinetochore protein [Hordeum vulgare]|nr:putative kinetochore protein [Hordeum vulgare]
MLFCVFKKAGHSDERNRIESKFIEYCNKHVMAKPADAGASSDTAAATAATRAAPAEDLKNWDAEFVKVDQATFFDLTLVATRMLFGLRYGHEAFVLVPNITY